jgi:ATP-binding cassette, sub-family E, member 1
MSRPTKLPTFNVGNNSNGRLAIVDYDKCKPTKCKKECMSRCPPNQIGKKCISIGDIEDITYSSNITEINSQEKGNNKKAIIANNICIGCGACVSMCPFKALSIVNLPRELSTEKQLVSYGENSFRVYMGPHIKKGSCIGILGSNGLGKSTIIKILSGDLKLDLPSKKKLLVGTELYAYLTQLENNKLIVSYKPQDISIFNRKKYGKQQVSQLLIKIPEKIRDKMDLNKLKNRSMNQLSGGETQRLVISLVCSKDAQSYLFDEPTAFLDVKQRIISASLIQEKVDSSYVVLIEHDLCIFDYISDFVFSLYGEKGAYGVVSSLNSTFNGINNYLEGYLPTENIRFRDKPIKFKIAHLDDDVSNRVAFNYGKCKFSYTENTSIDNEQEDFNLTIDAGTFSTSEITLLVGENGCGKSTMIKILAGIIKVDGFDRPDMGVSIKDQEVYIDSDMNVHDYIYKKIGNTLYNQEFKTGVLVPLGIEKLFDLTIKNVSGGQMQRIAITMCLGTSADIYLLDEPSAYIDVEDRLNVAHILRHFAMFNKKSIFLVEHDMIMATSACDKVIVFTGEPGIKCKASSPVDIKTGINQFLAILGVTMRRDKYSGSGRPRINKKDSSKDQDQKKSGQYFFID